MRERKKLRLPRSYARLDIRQLLPCFAQLQVRKNIGTFRTFALSYWGISEGQMTIFLRLPFTCLHMSTFSKAKWVKTGKTGSRANKVEKRGNMSENAHFAKVTDG